MLLRGPSWSSASSVLHPDGSSPPRRPPYLITLTDSMANGIVPPWTSIRIPRASASPTSSPGIKSRCIHAWADNVVGRSDGGSMTSAPSAPGGGLPSFQPCASCHSSDGGGTKVLGSSKFVMPLASADRSARWHVPHAPEDRRPCQRRRVRASASTPAIWPVRTRSPRRHTPQCRTVLRSPGAAVAISRRRPSTERLTPSSGSILRNGKRLNSRLQHCGEPLRPWCRGRMVETGKPSRKPKDDIPSITSGIDARCDPVGRAGDVGCVAKS